MAASLIPGYTWSAAETVTATKLNLTNSPQVVVGSIALLKAVTVTSLSTGCTAYVDGYSTTNDGGQGWFYYDSTSVATANLGTVFAPDSGSGRWIRLYSGELNLRWFGADNTGVATCTAALNSAMGLIAPVNGGVIYAPQGTYLYSTKPNAIDGGITIRGDGIGRTVFTRGYSEGSAHLGFMDMTCGGGRSNAGGGLRDLTLSAASATTGGAGVGAASSSSVGQGQLYFQNVSVAGAGTWNYPWHFDGTAKTSAAIGLRITSMVGCSAFQADVEGIYATGVVHFNIVNTGIFATGGNATAGFTLDGTTSVPSSNVQAFFEFCSSMNLAATSSNSVSEVLLSSTNAATLTVTSNLSSAVYIGKCGSLSGTCDGLTLIGPSGNTFSGGQANIRSPSGNQLVMQPTEAYSSAQSGSVGLQPIYTSGGSRILVSQIKQSRTSTADGQYASQIELLTRTAAGSLTTALTAKGSQIINLSNTPDYADNAAALAGGLVAGDIYRTTDALKIVH